jgi:hypothetical protein
MSRPPSALDRLLDERSQLAASATSSSSAISVSSRSTRRAPPATWMPAAASAARRRAADAGRGAGNDRPLAGQVEVGHRPGLYAGRS